MGNFENGEEKKISPARAREDMAGDLRTVYPMPQSGPNKDRAYTLDELATRMQIVELYQQGYTIQQIVERLGLSKDRVSREIRQVREEAAAYLAEDIQTLLADQMGRYNRVITEAWQAWQRSKEPEVRRQTKKVSVAVDGMPDRSEETTEHREKPGDPRYLDVILRALENINRLTGLNTMTVNHVVTFETQAAEWILAGELSIDDIRAEFGDETANRIAEIVHQRRLESGKAKTIEGKAFVVADNG